MTTLATLRRKSTRPPLATMSTFSSAPDPKKQHRVVAVLTLECVVAVTGVPLEDVVVRTHQGEIVAVVAEDEVVAAAAEERVGTLRAEERVVQGPTVDRQLDDVRRQGGGGDVVVAAQRVDHE